MSDPFTANSSIPNPTSGVPNPSIGASSGSADDTLERIINNPTAATISTQTGSYIYQVAHKETGSSTHVAGSIVKQAAINATNSPDNYVKETYERVQNVRAVCDVVRGNYKTASAARDYDAFVKRISSDSGSSAYLDSIGYGHEQERVLERTLSQVGYKPQDLSDIISGKTQLSEANVSQITRISNRVQTERVTRESFFSAKTMDEKAAAMSKLHQTGLNALKINNMELYQAVTAHGTSSTAVSGQIAMMLSSGKLSAAEKQLLTSFQSYGTSAHATLKGGGALKERGKRIIIKGLVGEDNQRAIDFIESSKTLIRTGSKLIQATNARRVIEHQSELITKTVGKLESAGSGALTPTGAVGEVVKKTQKAAKDIKRAQEKFHAAELRLKNDEIRKAEKPQKPQKPKKAAKKTKPKRGGAGAKAAGNAVPGTGATATVGTKTATVGTGTGTGAGGAVKEAAKGTVGKFLLIFAAICAAITFIVLIFGSATMFGGLAFAIHFFDDNEEPYIQNIIDSTTYGIAKDFYQICQQDATIRILKKQPVPTDVYPACGDDIQDHDWLMMPKKGLLYHIWAWEEADNTSLMYDSTNDEGYSDITKYDDVEGLMDTYKVASVRPNLESLCDNMLPVTSMMHTRYLGNIDEENWMTACGYVYYMFAISHDISMYDSTAEGYNKEDPAESAYSYKIEDPCSTESLYEEGVEWDAGEKKVVRSAEVCKNLYIHDYGKYYTQKTAEKIYKEKAKRGTFKNEELFLATNETFCSIMDIDLGRDNPLLGAYMWTSLEESLPHQHKATEEMSGYQCNNYIEAQYSEEEEEGLIINQPHVFNEQDSQWKGIYDETCHVHNKEEGNSCYQVVKSWQIKTGEHTDFLTGETVDEFTTYHEYDYSKFVCEHGRKYQSTGGHKPWNGKDDPGCWSTVCVCAGHCGGHIIPLVDIVQNMTWEGLMQEDCFKTPRFLLAEDLGFDSEGLTYVSTLDKDPDSSENLEKYNSSEFMAKVQNGHLLNAIEGFLTDDEVATVDAFRIYWKTKINQWYSPFANSPLRLIKSFKQDVIAGLNKLLDFPKEFIKNILGFGESESSGSDFEVNDEEEDIFGFDGWYDKEDGDIVDSGHLEELVSLYGDYNFDEPGTGYEWGEENWDAFEVKFYKMWCSQFSEESAHKNFKGLLADLGYDWSYFGITDYTYNEELGKYEFLFSEDCDLLPEQKAFLDSLALALERAPYIHYEYKGVNDYSFNSSHYDCTSYAVALMVNAGIWSPEVYNKNSASYITKGLMCSAGVGANGGKPLATKGGEITTGSIIISPKANRNNDGFAGLGHAMVVVGENPENGKIIVTECAGGKTDGIVVREYSKSYITSKYPYSINPWEYDL